MPNIRRYIKYSCRDMDGLLETKWSLRKFELRFIYYE